MPGRVVTSFTMNVVASCEEGASDMEDFSLGR